MFHSQRKMFVGKIRFMASWQLPVCFFYFFFFCNRMSISLKISSCSPNSWGAELSQNIVILLNYPLFLTSHFQSIYSMFTYYVFYILMQLYCHCICINIVSDNLSWLAIYYSSKQSLEICEHLVTSYLSIFNIWLRNKC